MIGKTTPPYRSRDAAILDAGVCAPMEFASFHDHARLFWRFHPLLNASDDALRLV
ncbi:hypothetical protein [Breoghania sp. L-A4]|uniref:hypothetical protein n=1 Tax=Breoghania sp. L-A4 TaxID=2304600 RepID=UPI0013C2AE15|nr:hypothetical protein [Breoghania sp. L-A4]